MHGLAFHRAQRPDTADRNDAQVIGVAACIVRDKQGRVLLSRRRPDQMSGGYWEIPGGKIEPGETAEEAAGRELSEETGLSADGLRPVSRYRHRFASRSIDLKLFEAQTWSGTPVSQECQRLEWVYPGAPQVAPILDSNRKALRLLSLPRVVLCTEAPVDGPAAWALSCARRAREVSAGAVLFACRTLPAAQQIVLARRLGAELARQGTALWLDAAPGGAVRTGAELTTELAGDASLRGSGLIHAVIDPNDCSPSQTDVVLTRLDRRIALPTTGIATLVYAITSSDNIENAFRAGAYGVCICDD